MQKRTRVKICCIASREEARLAIRFGADALGFVSAMPSGPGPIPDERIAEIVPAVPPGVAAFLLTCQTDAESIVLQQRRCRTNVIQLCDRVDPTVHSRLRADMPGVSLVQVVHVGNESAVEEALSAAPFVDAILLDSGNPYLAVKELGGTGRIHDWAVSRRIVSEASVPIYLAGGLTAANVGEAIGAVRPFGVDVCSGVRMEGRLDESKLAAFMESVAAAQ